MLASDTTVPRRWAAANVLGGAGALAAFESPTAVRH
jgi:hypothetical protein